MVVSVAALSVHTFFNIGLSDEDNTDDDDDDLSSVVRAGCLKANMVEQISELVLFLLTGKSTGGGHSLSRNFKANLFTKKV